MVLGDVTNGPPPMGKSYNPECGKHQLGEEEADKDVSPVPEPQTSDNEPRETWLIESSNTTTSTRIIDVVYYDKKYCALNNSNVSAITFYAESMSKHEGKAPYPYPRSQKKSEGGRRKSSTQQIQRMTAGNEHKLKPR